MSSPHKRLLGFAIAGLVLAAVSPRVLGAVFPLLFFAACPIAMTVVIRRMRSGVLHTVDRSAAELRRVGELEEEVNRLRAELQLRDGQQRE